MPEVNNFLSNMEVFRSEEFYIFVQDDVSLWWSRVNGEFLSKSAWDLSDIQDIECLGTTHAIIGKLEHEAVYEPRLMIVKDCSPVGTLYDDHIIYKIKSICLLTLGNEDTDLNLLPCKKHSSAAVIRSAPSSAASSGQGSESKIGKKLFENSMFVNKTWGAVKSAGNTIKNTTQQAAAIATSQVKHTVNKARDSKERDRLEKRISDELHKIFDDTESFYFCKTADVTSSLQRAGQFGPAAGHATRWRNADDRFFWNKHMLRDILDMGSPQCDPWIVPIIQGHVKVRRCEVDAMECSRHLNTESLRGNPQDHRELFTLSLISRRSRYRAGTRYKRRGIDEDGHVANYVETEQCLLHQTHRVSFVQVRGSAPLYWSQPGHKYRPPPILYKGEQETQLAFDKHLDSEKELYGPVCIVNLVEQVGREKVIWDAFSNHIYSYNSPDIVYATFDFHEYCRGMHFENVAILINSLSDIIADMGYCWRDPQGYICRQNGVFRVNCIDCLDRTNVVQTAIAKAVLEMQVTRLGLSGPDWPLPAGLRTALHDLWADNGDVISRQYAGTNALKGDYTRTGERKFTGIMKDGMNSANRYYIQHFADAFRQLVIDLLLGQQVDNQELEREMNLLTDLKTVGNITCDNIAPAIIDIPPLEKEVPGYYIQTAREEILAINIVYGVSSYYLSRFKDAFRQATVDLMLGHARAGDFYPGQEVEQGEPEEGHGAAPDHVKHLMEDCKKLLVSDTNSVLQAWGLIDADPGTGDPNETEMDSIVILTRDSYLVADYDDQSDRVTGFQKLDLKDVTLIEFGVMESSSQISLTSLKSNLSMGSSKRAADGALCVRIHYRSDGADGFFHTFRSTNLRFFNNMAVYINTNEEIHESLRSICECFLIAMDVGNLPRVPFHQGGKLDRRKSKVRQSSSGVRGRGSLYLELSGLPGITRNLSGTQLAIKTAGSKALTNMSEQFSKLNKLGQTFNNRGRSDSARSSKPETLTSAPRTTFSLGKSSLRMASKKHTKGAHSDCTSSDNSSDDDEGKTNIFEPTLDNFENCVRYVGDNPLLKSTTDAKNDARAAQIMLDSQTDANSEAYLIENPLYSSKIDTQTSGHDSYSEEYLAQAGITIPKIDGSKRPNLKLDTAILDSSINYDAVSCSSIPPHSATSHKMNPFDVDSDSKTMGSEYFDTKTMGSEYFDASSETARSTTPEITINFEDAPSKWDTFDSKSKAQPPSSLKLNQKLSHSSGEVDVNIMTTVDDMALLSDSKYDLNKDGGQPIRSASQHEINLNISSSQSESALKQLKNLTSPVATVTKDLVMSPFSKFAKGMQSLGANLDPRKVKGVPMVRQLTEQQFEEHKKLQEKWRKCNTKLIAL